MDTLRKFLVSIYFWAIILFAFQCKNLNGQFKDDFSDGNFNLFPSWQGDTTSFFVNQKMELNLNAPIEWKSSKLFTNSVAIENARWKFKVMLDFNPSSSNYVDVHIVHDSIHNFSRGYFVRIGGTKDEISLYRKDSIGSVKLIDGKDKSTDQKTNTINIYVTRNKNGLWSLKRDTIGSNNWIIEGTKVDTTHTKSTHFLLECTFTKTRVDKFRFDNFEVSGQKLSDKTPPQVISIKPNSNKMLEILFSEPVDSTSSLNIENFIVPPKIGHPEKVKFNNLTQNSIDLSFKFPFLNGAFSSIEINNIEDTSGNKLIFYKDSFFYFVPDSPLFKDLIFSEIYPNPHDDSNLPTGEYLEIFNRSNKTFDLKNFIIADKTKEAPLSSFIFYPKEYLILCKNKDTSDFKKFGKTLGVELPSLNNDGDHLKLSYHSNIIDELAYSKEWHQNLDKKEGGWALELINLNFLCPYINNWKASTSPLGGTPGNINSVIDSTENGVVKAFDLKLVNDSSFSVKFSEPFDTSKISLTRLNIDGNFLNKFTYPIFDKINFNLPSPPKEGTTLELTIEEFPTCWGYFTSYPITSNTLEIPYESHPNDVLISEILFNPKSGGSDFVEVFNTTNTIFDLKGWTLGNFDGDTIGNLKSIADTSLLLQPGQYMAFTNNKDYLISNYPQCNPSNILELNQLPNYNNDSSTVYLINKKGVLLDRFSYNENMHNPHLSDTKGVSLERIHFNNQTNNSNNWHSAAESIGYASPGIKNSQFVENSSTSQIIEINPKLITPNGDGLDDFLSIFYKLSSPGCRGNIIIFNEKGQLVKQLEKLSLLSTEGIITWDGTNDNQQWVPSGNYIVFIEISNSLDIYLKEKKVVGLRR